MSGALAFPLTVAALQARIADPARLRADRPAPREDAERAARAGGRMTPAAVLVPLVLHPEPTVLLTLRSADLKAHAGQVSFPGGRLEEGETPIAAALREAEEEIGLHTGLPEIVGELPPLLTGTGFIITPVVALLRPPFSLATGLLWATPLLALLFGLFLIRRRRAVVVPAAPLTAEERARLDQLSGQS